jgi:hypothetical protein
VEARPAAGTGDLASLAMTTCTLTEALSRVDRLRCGEVVAVFGPLADALAAAHAAGLVHGDVRSDGVLLTDDGQPRFAEADLAPGEPAADVRDFADLLIRALLGVKAVPAGWLERAFGLGVPAPLVAVLAAAVADEPRRRPGAAELAAALRATCGALPLARLLVATGVRA